MKIIYFSKRAGFIPNLKSKIAQYTCQIRAWSCIEEENQISFKIWFLFEKYWMLQIKSFFTLFSLQILSINTQHCVQAITRNPSSSQTLIIANFFSQNLKNRILDPATFSLQESFHCLQEVGLSKDTLLALIKSSRIEPYTCIHNQFFLEIALLLSACFNRF